MKVLSLFDGISCGLVALKRVGIKVEKYWASEIDKYAIQISKKNHPEIEHIGDVREWQKWDIDYSKIDLVFGGFPCTSWSVAGKQLGDRDERGQLFWVMLDIMREVQKNNPKAKFLIENVKMKKEFEEYITFHTTQALGEVSKTLIDSALVSAQNRRRIYWSNIPNITQPADKGIVLKDIIHEYTVKYNRKDGIVSKTDKALAICSSDWRGINRNQNQNAVYDIIADYIVPFDTTFKLLEKEVARGKVGYFRKDSQANRVYFIHDKAVTLCGSAGGGAAKMGMYLITENSDDVLVFGCITPDRVNKRQNGQRFSDGKKFYTLAAQDRHGILTEGYIRKLTPVECERLQTLEDGYTEGISDSRRYSALGNAWTADVIAHILKGLKSR